MSAVKKAVFPVAGLGTRFLPATKASPKEMMPIVDKPLIQYAVEEALKIAQASEGEVTVVTMGPEGAADAIRKALQMGADGKYPVPEPGIKIDREY